MQVAWPSRVALLILVLCGFQIGLAAPARTDRPVSGSEVVSSAAGGPTMEQIQAKLTALAANRDMPDDERKQAQEFYQQALSQLQAAKNYADNIAYFQQMQQSAPAEAIRLRQKLGSESPSPPPANLPADELSQQLTQTQTDLSNAQKQLMELDQQLSVQQARPKAIPVEFDSLTQQLADLESRVRTFGSSVVTPLIAEARLLLAGAQRQALNQQIAALEQERLSYDARFELLNAQRTAAARDVTQARTRTQQLQDLLNAYRRDEAAAVVHQTAQAKQEVAAKPAIVQTVADENTALSRRLADIVQQSDAAQTEQARISDRLSQLSERMLGVRQQLSIAGSSDAIGPILLEERRNLPDVSQYQRNAGQLQQRLIQARLEQYRGNETLHQVRDEQGTLKKIAEGFDPQWTETQRQAVTAELGPLLASRQALLEKLGGSYANLITGLVALDDVQRKLAEQARLYGELLDRHLLWVRSSSPLNAEWLSNFGLALDWLLEPAHWWEVWQNLSRGALNRPELAALGGLLLLALLYYRRPLIRRLTEGVDLIGDVRRDSFGLTARALTITVLLALPWPFLLAGLAWLLKVSGNAAEFSQGLKDGLFAAAAIVLNITLLRQLCRPRGIAIAHFGWAEAGCRHARRHLYWFVWVGSLSALLVQLCDAQADPLYSNTLGRLAFFGGMLALAALLGRVLSPTQPLIGALADSYTKTLIWRTRYAWYWGVVGSYLFLALLALSGYYYTALQLRGRMMWTAWLLLGLLVLVNLFVRWLNISQRRLALQRALAKREAQLAARATKEATLPSGESIPPELLQVPDLDLTTINEQTRGIMNLLVWLGLGFGLWQIWEGLVPAFAVLNEIALWQQTLQSAAGSQVVDITLGSLLVAAVLLVLVGLMAHNLPGVLELVVLRRLTVDPGNRNAIITIVRYLIVGVGLVVALSIIGVNWERVQWLVAALSVGLGFGLQEIFANFISGLILLLERPIRVGDTVTLGDQSGTVARIHIRATTLVDWDRKEIIVPNKTFITSALINWTRNDSITRIIVPVGVSYDSDPARVHDLLLEVATSHPLVLNDPAPAVLFLKFGESALEFEVRVFVRELVNRLSLTHELHSRIIAVLRANQIEIPFPQREVYLRGWPKHINSSEAPTAEPRSTPTPVQLNKS